MVEHPKLQQLRSFIRGRPICFQASGPSIIELKEHIHKIPKDVVWVGHNVFLPMEKIIEETLDYHLDMVYISSPQTIEAYGTRIREFLERPESNLFLTTTGAEKFIEASLPGLLKNHQEKIIVARCESGAPLPDHAFNVVQFFGGNIFSFALCFLLLLKAGATKIVSFGLDGGIPQGYTNWHYGKYEDYPGSWYREQPNGYGPEVEAINRDWSNMVKAAALDGSTFEILNCSPNSHINCFKKIRYKGLGSIW